MSLLIRDARVVTGDGTPALPRANVRVDGDRITARRRVAGPADAPTPTPTG